MILPSIGPRRGDTDRAITAVHLIHTAAATTATATTATATAGSCSQLLFFFSIAAKK